MAHMDLTMAALVLDSQAHMMLWRFGSTWLALHYPFLMALPSFIIASRRGIRNCKL